MGIDKVGRVTVIHPASTLNLLILFGEPVWISSFCIIPDQDGAVILQGRPDLDFSLTGNLSLGIGYLGAEACLSVILPAMEGTLNAPAINLQSHQKVKRSWQFKFLVPQLCACVEFDL